MRGRIRSLLWTFVVACTLGAGGPALAALTEVGPLDANNLPVGIEPNGYPQFYGDANGLRLQLCPATDPMCISAPVDPADPASVALGVGEESFWWSADAFINVDTPDVLDLPPGLDGQVTLALEGAFGGTGVVRDGDQIVFGRIRIRVDAPVAGTYTITHPFGVEVFENVTVADGINFTQDIGAINVLAPAAGFAGALRAKIGPFLTWPDYANPVLNPTLQVPVLDPVTGLPTGEVIQYVGDPTVEHAVTGSTFVPAGESEPANYFRIQGPDGIDVTTSLFTVTGRVLPDPAPATTVHVFPPPPPQNLFAVGPVNRIAPFVLPTTGTVTGALVPNYPVGYPLWYQENAGTPEAPVGGLKLTLCPPASVDPMCISAEIDPNDPASTALNTGEEAFWWSAEGFINANSTDIEGTLPAGLDGQVTLALEAAFGGTGVPNDGDQIAFGRVRVRVDVPEAGTYTITHPYGVEVFENVTVADGIFFTRDLGVINPLDPDGSFVGALYSNIGPKVLTWPNYQAEPSLKVNGAQYVGDPAVEHVVTGSTFIPEGEALPANYFRIEGPNGIDVKTSLFVVTGKVFDPASLPLPIGVFRAGTWELDVNGNGIWDGLGVDSLYTFGLSGDLPVVGDWNGDGIDQVGVFRNGRWYLDANGNGVWDGATVDTLFPSFGLAGDRPVAGDWDGDGIDQIGVFRNGRWYLDNGNGAWNPEIDTVYNSFGLATDMPVAGDWDGDGIDQIGAFRNGRWYLDNGNGAWDPGIDTVYTSFGLSGDKPVVGDWNLDGRDQIGVMRGNKWYLDMDGNGAWNVATDRTFLFGQPGDIPLAGRW